MVAQIRTFTIDKQVKTLVNAGLGGLSEQVKTVYEKDMIDKKICGERDVNLSIL